MPVEVIGPTGETVHAWWMLISTSEGGQETGVIDLAVTSGIELLSSPLELRPLDASSTGFGQAIRAAVDHGVNRLVLAIGSSASSDGGAGMLQAPGATVVDDTGVNIGLGARGLDRAAAIDLSGLPTIPPGGAIVLSDVTSPLLGPRGAAATFGPQKGADAADITRIERALQRWASLIGDDPATSGTGAAGGVGYALHACGAQLRSGARTIADLIGLEVQLSTADLIVTGEGRFRQPERPREGSNRHSGHRRTLGGSYRPRRGNDRRRHLQLRRPRLLTGIAGSAARAIRAPSGGYAKQDVGSPGC